MWTVLAPFLTSRRNNMSAWSHFFILCSVTAWARAHLWRGSLKIKKKEEKNPYISDQLLYMLTFKSRIWFGICENLSQPHPPTLCTKSTKSICGWCWEAHTSVTAHRKCYMPRHEDNYCSTLHIWHILRFCKHVYSARGADSECEPLGWTGAHLRSLQPTVGVSSFLQGMLVVLRRQNPAIRLMKSSITVTKRGIFTIYLTSCIPKAHIRHCWLVLAYSSRLLMHSLPLLWSSGAKLPPLLDIESFAFLMFTVRKPILYRRDEIWDSTGNQGELLKRWK